MRQSFKHKTALWLCLTLAPIAAPALLSSSALAQTSVNEDPEALFGKGVALFEKRQYRAAIDIFRALFDKDPDPTILFNIGRCYEELGEEREAVGYYERALLLEGMPAEARAEAAKRIEKIKPGLKLAAKEMRDARTGFEMASMVLKMAVSRSVERASIEGDKLIEASARTAPQSAAPPGRSALTIVGASAILLGASAISVGGFYLMDASQSLQRQTTLEDQFSAQRNAALSGSDPVAAGQALATASDINNLADDIEEDQKFATALFATGGAALLTGIILVLVDGPEEDESPSSWRLEPLPGGLRVTANF